MLYSYEKIDSEVDWLVKHAGYIANEIKTELGYKLEAEVEGDTGVVGFVKVDSIVVGNRHIHIECPELTANEKTTLDSIMASL